MVLCETVVFYRPSPEGALQAVWQSQSLNPGLSQDQEEQNLKTQVRTAVKSR